MRVLVLSSAFPSQTRPTYAVFVRERVRHVAAHCQVAVVAPVPWFPLNRYLRGAPVSATPRADIERGGMPVYYPRFVCPPLVGKSADAVLYAASIAPVLAGLRRRYPFDLIDAHFTYPDGVAAVVLGRMLRIPVVVTVRGTHDLRHAEFALRRMQIRYALRHARRVIAVSGPLRDFIVRLGVEAGRVHVIANGVDATRFLPRERAAARARLGLPKDARILVSVGSLVEGKGHHRIIEALPAITARCPDLIYVVVGDELPGTNQRRALERCAHRHGVAHHIRLVGPTPHDDIPSWLAASNLFCLATRSEGSCNAIIEALACGVPVVTTRVGGNDEIVQHGRDGFLVPFWDPEAFRAAVFQALERTWDPLALSARVRAGAWEQTTKAVLQVFADAVGYADVRAEATAV